MHAAAQWTAFSGLHQGATVVVHDDSGSFDAAAVLELAEREQVALMSIVGDAYAGPIVEELRRRPYDLSSLIDPGHGRRGHWRAAQGGAARAVAHIVIMDGYGASETGGMAYGARTKDSKSRGFAPSAGRHRDLGGPHPLPASPARTSSGGRRAAAVSRSATCTTASGRRRPSRSSTASGSPSPATGPG